MKFYKDERTDIMKIISWNIDSLNAALTGSSDRALLTRELLKNLAGMKAEIIAIQETKLPTTGMNAKQETALKEIFPDYRVDFVSSEPPARKGYAGTMMLYRENCGIAIDRPKIGAPDTMDSEGRIITLETADFYLVCVYTPNAGDGLKRLKERQEWDIKFKEYLQELDKKKPVISCGDFNVAHEEIDLANPASNHFSAGFTDEERAGFTELLKGGFVDSFRYINGDIKDKYSWWSQRIKTSKTNNSGWRIDYFIVSERIKDKVKKSDMIDSGARADHAPIFIEF